MLFSFFLSVAAKNSDVWVLFFCFIYFIFCVLFVYSCAPCLRRYLIHFPIPLRFVPFETRYPPEWIFDPEAFEPRMEYSGVSVAETWGAMEQLADAGLARNIGVANWDTAGLRDMLAYARIPPAVNQVSFSVSHACTF